MEIFSFFGHRLGYAQLVGMGVHVGHSRENSTAYGAWMIYGYRAGVCLIDLFQFVAMLRFGFSVVDLMVALGRPLWFVNKDKSFSRYVRYYALKCGEFSSTLLWIRGMLSNFRVVGHLAKKHFLLSDLARGRRLVLLDRTLGHWFLTRYTWPGLVFVSSVTWNYFVVNETFSCQVPCMGIADSDALAQGCSIVVPGNDDSLDSVVFYHDLVAEYILYRKFCQVYLWFLNVRRSKRLLGFQDWLGLKKEALAALDLGFFFASQSLQKYAFGKVLLGFFFAQGGWAQAIAEQIKVYRDQEFFDVHASVDDHEPVLGRYFYFFSFFFFSRLSQRQGNFLLAKRSRQHWRLRYRRSTFMFLRKARQWRTFKMVNWRQRLHYLGRLYNLRKGSLAYRGLLRRLVHYYFFFYYLYFRDWRRYRFSFRRRRSELLGFLSRRRLYREYHCYWRYFRRFFRRHWNYEGTIRLGTARQRSRLFRRRFGIFHLLFKLYHEPSLKRILKDRWAKARELRRKNKHRRYVQVSRFVRIRFERWHRWYRGAALSFFSQRRLRRKYFFNLLIPELAPEPPGPVFGRARQRRLARGPKAATPALVRRRRQQLARLHGLVTQGARRLRRQLSGGFSFRPFFRTLKGHLLRFMVYGFFRPSPLADSFFLRAEAFYRDPGSAPPFRFQSPLGRGGPRRLLRHYSSGSRSLLFRGRKRKFFIGYIPFGVGAQALQHLRPAYDFSLGHQRLSFFFRGPRRGQFFLGRGSHKARAPRGPRKPPRPRLRQVTPVPRPRLRQVTPVPRPRLRQVTPVPRPRLRQGPGVYGRRPYLGAPKRSKSRRFRWFQGLIRWLFNKRFF